MSILNAGIIFFITRISLQNPVLPCTRLQWGNREIPIKITGNLQGDSQGIPVIIVGKKIFAVHWAEQWKVTTLIVSYLISHDNMRREQLILPPLTAFEVTIFRNEPLPYPAIYKVHRRVELQDKFLFFFNYQILHFFQCMM